MRKKFTMLLASLFLCMGAWAQVEEGKAYYLKVSGLEGAYIDAKNGVDETSGQTITISSEPVYVYFKAGADGKWKISVNPDLNGGFLKVNRWCANPNETEDGQTEWSFVSTGETDLYYLTQEYYQGNSDANRIYLGNSGGNTVGSKLFTDQPVGNAVKVEFVEAQTTYAVDATTGTGVATNSWKNSWTYTATEANPVALTLTCKYNDMQAAADNSLQLYVGQHSSDTYTLSVPEGSLIIGYSFDFVKATDYTDVITLTVGSNTYNPTTEVQTVTVNNIGAQSTSFTLAGANKGIKVTNFNVYVVILPVDITALETAIANAESFIASTAFSFVAGEKVALSVGDGGNLTTNYPAIDDDVLKNCIDGDPATLFHSNWNAGTNGGHYLQVDLGESVALNAFVLDYTTRQSGNNGAPYSMTISGSNDNAEFTEIKTLTKDDVVNPLPDKNAMSYSAALATNTAYRYLRFTVNSSPNSNGSFGLAEFAITKATASATEDYSKRLSLINTLNNTVLQAKIVMKNSALQLEVDAAQAMLEDALAAARIKDFPFTLTTDINNPVCYLIKSSRSVNGQWGNPSYWNYQASGDNASYFTIKEYGNENGDELAKKDINAYWYFVENNDGYLEMVPFVSSTSMGYTTVADGAKKLTTNHSAQGFVDTKYAFVNESNSNWEGYPYALKPYGYNTFVSNHGGRGNMMGFYNEINDGGTRFTLVEVATPSAKLADLNSAIVRAQACTPGEKVGEYSAEGIEALAAVIAAAQAVYADASSTDAMCQEQINALNTAIEQAVRTITEGYYRLICVAPKTGNGGDTSYNTLTFNGVSNLVTAPTDSKNVNQIFKFVSTGTEGKYYIQSPNAGKYLNKISAGDYRSALVDQADACKVQFLSYGNAQYEINNSESAEFHSLFAENHPTETVPYACAGWDNGINSASAWYIIPATTIEYTLSDIAGEGYASVCLPFDVTLDENVMAHAVTATGTDAATLTEKTDIKANEGAILIGTPGTHTFTIATASSDWDGNLLEGTTVDAYVVGPAYVLANGGNGIGLYKAELNKDVNGAESTTHFKNNANKAYLPIKSNAPMFSFDRGEGTTEIENSELKIENSVVIYDLLGRRVEKMEKGIYIVNGKKVIK